MRIRGFTPFIAKQLDLFILKEYTDVVIDGDNYMHKTYRDSTLPFAFGADSDKYADYLKQCLQHFKRANIKCHFIFHGGREENMRELKKQERITDRIMPEDFVPGTRFLTAEQIVLPIFMKDIWIQVLDEMGFQYSISAFEAKADCVALARKLNCPILSNDVEFCFFGVPYIPYTTLKSFEQGDGIKCEIFSLERFMKKFNVNEQKLAMFIVLMDRYIFPENFFGDFMKSVKIPLFANPHPTIVSTLFWLSKNSEEKAVEKIFQYIDDESKKKFLDEVKNARNFIDYKPPSTITTRYMEDNDAIKIYKNDPEWFNKGVCLKHIPKTYINLYRWNYMHGSWAIEDLNENAMLFSFEIIKYALDLLTNFQNEGFTFETQHESKELRERIVTSIEKPEYDAKDSVFENGWNNLRELKLFEHFLNESIPEFDLTNLESIPEELKVLMIALVYFYLKKGSMQKEVHSILLSHIMLGVVFEKINEENQLENDTCTVSVEDCNEAASVMNEYFQLTPEEEREIFDRQMLHPLVQFQFCLQQMNFLNQLCGKPFTPTVYHKTYNATFVYKILYNMKQCGDDNMEFINRLLKPAPTVLQYFHKIVKIHDQMIGH